MKQWISMTEYGVKEDVKQWISMTEYGVREDVKQWISMTEYGVREGGCETMDFNNKFYFSIYLKVIF